MEFTLKLIPIETIVKKNYYILIDNNLLKVENIDYKEKNVTLSDNNIYPIKDIRNKVAKFIGEYDNQTYSIIHGNFDSIADFLKSKINNEDEETNKTYLDALLEGVTIKIQGAFETIYTKTVPNEAVEITNISIIDANSIYHKDERIGVVTKFDKNTHKFTIKLTKGNVITCNREDFTKIGVNNKKSMLRCVCNKCGK